LNRCGAICRRILDWIEAEPPDVRSKRRRSSNGIWAVTRTRGWRRVAHDLGGTRAEPTCGPSRWRSDLPPAIAGSRRRPGHRPRRPGSVDPDQAALADGHPVGRLGRPSRRSWWEATPVPSPRHACRLEGGVEGAARQISGGDSRARRCTTRVDDQEVGAILMSAVGCTQEAVGENPARRAPLLGVGHRAGHAGTWRTWRPTSAQDPCRVSRRARPSGGCCGRRSLS